MLLLAMAHPPTLLLPLRFTPMSRPTMPLPSLTEDPRILVEKLKKEVERLKNELALATGQACVCCIPDCQEAQEGPLPSYEVDKYVPPCHVLLSHRFPWNVLQAHNCAHSTLLMQVSASRRGLYRRPRPRKRADSWRPAQDCCLLSHFQGHPSFLSPSPFSSLLVLLPC